MTGRKGLLAACIACALLVSAFAAQSASAVTRGTTAFTCVLNQPPANLWGEHCLGSNPGGGEQQAYGHKEIPPNVTTHATVTNAKTASATTAATKFVLKTTLGGIPLVLTSTSVHTTPETWLENKTTAGGEHYIHGEGKVTFDEIVVSEPPNCKLVSAHGEKKLETNQLTGTTEAQGDNALFKPALNNVLAEFSLVNNGGACAAAAANIKIVGSVRGQPDTPGATLTFTHATTTAEGTLRIGSAMGPKVGLEGKLTFRAGEGKAEEGKPTNPISATTIETP